VKATAQLTALDVQRADVTVRPQASREKQHSETRRRRRTKPHVLLVDVDVLSRARFGRSLVQAGVDVTVADAFEDAVLALDDISIDAIVLLTTISEPQFDVVSFLEEVASIAPDMVVVAQSHTPGAYELFLRSFGFRRTAVIGADTFDAGKRVRELAESL
jgi:PleD family two-component response regulator